MATAYDRVKDRFENGRLVHVGHHNGNSLSADLNGLIEDYEEANQHISQLAKMVPTGRQAHIEDVFTAFQTFFSDVQKMQNNCPVAAWGKQLDVARERLKTRLTTLGLAQHIIWEPRE